MIEPTDEMVQAFDGPKSSNLWVREGLRNVLAIVARDHCMEPRGHVYHPLRRCGAPGPDGLTCQRGPDHDNPEDGNHAASDGDGLVQW